MTSIDLAALDRDGFVVIAGALARPLLAALSAAYDAGSREQATAGERGTQHLYIDAAAAPWREIAEHPALLAAARHVLGATFHIGRLHGRNPLPGFGQQGLHPDWVELEPGEPWQVLTALFLLDGFTADNGATRLVPGSHRRSRPLPKPLAQPLAHHPGEILVTAPAGAALIFNGHVLHSGTQNRSPGPRRALQIVVQAGTASRGMPAEAMG